MTHPDIATRLAERLGPLASISRVAADASQRLFHRVESEPGRFAIALSDPDGGDAAYRRLLAAHALLEEVGVPVPRIVERLPELTTVVFEDFGDLLLADALPGMPTSERVERYRSASEIAGRIMSRGTVKVTEGHPLADRPLARERLRIELAFFVTHDVAGRRGVSSVALFGELNRALNRLADELDAVPRRLAHRDFHARNLMVTPRRTLGVVDFQDAVLAPIHYDLASLIYDPYVDLDSATIREAAGAYAEVCGSALDPLDDPRLPWVALQRLLKALGTYAFQIRQRGNDRFVAAVERAERRALIAADRIPDAFGVSTRRLLDQLGFAG